MQSETRKRLLYLALGIAAFVISYLVGSGVELGEADARAVVQQFYGEIGDIDQTGIFINNVRIALAMFIPALGAGLGVFSGFSTGLVFSAIIQTSSIEILPHPLEILVTPFGIMEVLAYGIAISRSAMLVHSLVKRIPWQNYLKYTLFEIGVVVALLLSGAIIEWQMIEQMGGLENLPDV